MSVFIYNIAIRLYYFAIYVASFFSLKARLWIAGRKKLHHRLRHYISSAHGKKIWFHCASLGEFEQARPLIERIRQQHPEHKLILTFFSPSGFEARRNYDGADFIGYLPLDTAYDARELIHRMKPSLVIWAKYEFWYNILSELHRKQIPTVLISSVFRPEQVFFKWYGPLHRRMLGFFTHIFVQNKESQALLHTLGVKAEICSDTRFDRVYNIAKTPKEIEAIKIFKGGKKLLIAGSTWRKDAEMLCHLINNDPFNGKFLYVIAPHDVIKKNVSYLIDKIPHKKVLMSRLTLKNAHKFDVVIVDTMGMLSSLYRYGDIAYVGGGFNASVHNILEPAAYGMPVIFGPHYQKSEEAKTLLKHADWHAACSLTNYQALVSCIQGLLDNDEANLKTGSDKAREYVQDNIGGTDKIYSYLADNKLL
jgi:3-deoxy-D-manno-octulosonic-acid transferase